MSTITPSWTENVNLHTSGSVAAGVAVVDDIDYDTLGADAAAIVIEVIFGATPDGDILVEVLNSSDSGTNDDTEPVASMVIPWETSATKRQTMETGGRPYDAIRVTNLNTTDSVTVDSWLAWRQWDST